MTFQVRRGVLWPLLPGMGRTDRSVTAEDVKWYFETQKKEGVYKNTFELVETFEVVDRYTLRLKWSQPHSTFVEMLANYGLAIVPRECYEDKANCLNKRLLSPGPFILDEASFQPRVRSVVLKNEEFWLKGLPYLDRMVGVTIADIAAQKAAFVTGKTDGYQTVTPRERDVLLEQVPKSRATAAYCSCGTAHFQVRLDKPPFDDVRVRRAVSMAINRPKAWKVANDGYNALGMPMAFDFLGLELYINLKTAGPYYQYNPEEAKRLLKEAGYDKGLTFSMFNSTTTYAIPETLISMQEDLKAVGVTMDIKQIDGTAMQTLRREKKWDGGIFNVCYDCNATDPDSYLLLAYSQSPRNEMGVNDRTIDEIYLKARGELDPARRQQLYWDFTNRVYDQVFGFHIGTPIGFEHYAPWLQNAASHVYAYSGVHNFASWVMWVDQSQMPK